jgi:DNA-binding transcriptional MerR regulator
MPVMTEKLYTVQQAAEMTGVSEHTLRYYEKSGLVVAIHREGTGRHRRYTEEDLRLIGLLKRLRTTGMPIREMQHFMMLYRAGNATLHQRREMLIAHRTRVVRQVEELQAHLDVIDYKINSYEALGAEANWDSQACFRIVQGLEEGETT